MVRSNTNNKYWQIGYVIHTNENKLATIASLVTLKTDCKYACQTCMTKYAYWFNVPSMSYTIFKEINKNMYNCNYDNVIVMVLTDAWKPKCNGI